MGNKPTQDVIDAVMKELPPYAYPPFVVEAVIECFLRHLPKPETPYEQAIAYRKMVGME